MVRSFVAFAYAPGALLTGIHVPDVDAIAAIRSPAGENAARWLHLMAATIVVVVIVPRLLLALIARVFEYHRGSRLLLPLDEPYFQRLLRGFRGRPARVRVIPYSHTPAPAAIAGLEAVIARTFGNVAVTFAQPVAYGADEVPAGDAAGVTLVVLFNASATPEREVHGTFLAALARAHPGAEALVALIDEGAWAAHWKGTPVRISERRVAWRQLGEEAHVPTVFVDLSAPDIAAAENAFDEAIAARAQ